MTTTIHPVLLCGGSGTRLWPLSRQSYPKQFAPLLGAESLFQGSARRLSGEGFADPVIVTGDAFRFITSEQLAAVGLKPAATLIEPAARNTAPAILAAALWLSGQDLDALMIVAPSDHVIPDTAAFRAAVQGAAAVARAGGIVTFGIRPTRPETGYGYLEVAPEGDGTETVARRLRRFVEKPGLGAAQEMLASGQFLWNAGIFLFTAKTMIEAFAQHAADMIPHAAAALEEARADLGFIRLAPGPWSRLTAISIDYAIMEKAQDLWVVPYEETWSDLGSWQAVWQESSPGEAGNVISPNAIGIDCENTLLRSEDENLQLVGLGLSDVVVVAMKDAVLVASKSEAQRVGEAVAALKARGAAQASAFQRDFRPWGWYESLALGSRFQVKRIVVHPGAALSLQSHHHRSEHWIVVAGPARGTIGDDVRLVSQNPSAHIPLGERHRLENPGKLPLTLIEVQTGAYLGEDDIIRYEDRYARDTGA